VINRVVCHSGYRYGERPKAFYWEDKKMEIAAIEKQWHEPNGYHFRVKTINNQFFEITYDQSLDEWTIKQA
jgi:hypothetical protein